MKITSEPIEPRQVKLLVELDSERLETAMEKVARSASRQMKVPGYRPGKVPYRRVVAILGEETLRKDALEDLGREAMVEALTQEGIVPSARLEIELESEDPPSFSALVPLPPEVDLGDYLALRVPEQESQGVTDADIDDVLERLREDVAPREPVERAAEADDMVQIAMEARRAEAEPEDETAIIRKHDEIWLSLSEEGAMRVGLPASLPDELIGLSAGDEHAFELDFPEDWPEEDLRGQSAAFTVTMAEVRERQLPDLDDEFAKTVSDADTLDALRERIRSDMELRGQAAEREARVESVIDALVARSEVSYPPAMRDEKTASMVAELRGNVERQGFTWERWLELQQKSEDQIWSDLQEQADERLRRGLVLGEFVHAEDLEVSKTELKAEVQRMESMFASLPKKSRPKKGDLNDRAHDRIITGRAIDRLLAIASGELEAEAAEAEDAEAQAAEAAESKELEA